MAVPFFRGASTHVFELARHLAHLNHEVHVVSRRLSWAQPKKDQFGGIIVHRIFRGVMGPLPLSRYHQTLFSQDVSSSMLSEVYEFYLHSGFALYAALACIKIIRDHGVDIVLERETSFGAGAIACRITGIPMVLEVIGPRCSRYSLQIAKKIVAYTELMVRDVDPRKLELVTAAANIDLFKPDKWRRELTRRRLKMVENPVVGYVGTFPRWHGIEQLIEASKMVLERFPETRFLMVGPYFEWAQEIVNKEGLSKAFLFTGPIYYENVPDYINASDILLALYDTDQSRLRRLFGIGSPLKIFEYMACGKPVIASRLVPIEQVISSGENGLLVSPGDPKEIAEAIILLLQNRELAESLGCRAAEDVASLYSWKKIARQFEKMLLEVVES